MSRYCWECGSERTYCYCDDYDDSDHEAQVFVEDVVIPLFTSIKGFWQSRLPKCQLCGEPLYLLYGSSMENPAWVCTTKGCGCNELAYAVGDLFPAIARFVHSCEVEDLADAASAGVWIDASPHERYLAYNAIFRLAALALRGVP